MHNSRKLRDREDKHKEHTQVNITQQNRTTESTLILSPPTTLDLDRFFLYTLGYESTD